MVGSHAGAMQRIRAPSPGFPVNRLVATGTRAQICRMPSVLDLELHRLRAMTATEKVATMHALWRHAWSLTAAGVRGRYQYWSEPQIEAEVRRLFQRGTS